MKIIRPIPVTGSGITTCNVPNVDNIGTSTTSLLIAAASKTFTTQASLPFVAGEWIGAYSQANPANYMYGKITSYSGTTLVINVSVVGGSGTLADWTLSYGWDVAAAYLDGDRVQISSVNKIYEALVNVTGGSTPPTDVDAAVPKWIEVSATNRWKAFDNVIGTQTEHADEIIYVIEPGAVFDSIAFLNLDATSIRLVMTDPIEGVVYDKTIDLQTTVLTGISTVMDWYTYFFSSIWKITSVVKLDVPPYLDAVFEITISYPGQTAKVGEIVFGLQTNLGLTQYGPSVGIHDYSTKEADTFGVYSIVQRAYSKKLSCDVFMYNVSLPDVVNILSYYRAMPLVWIGHEDYETLIVYGYYKDFSIVMSYPAYSICSLEIEGLT